MKPIELTEEHIDKLFEMCEKVFPQYNFSKVGFKDKLGTIYYGLKDSDVYTERIHWFEFCLTILRVELNIFYEDMCFTLNPSASGEDFEHPIDNIYSEFKIWNKT